jgi:hypothetical protein
MLIAELKKYVFLLAAKSMRGIACCVLPSDFAKTFAAFEIGELPPN